MENRKDRGLVKEILVYIEDNLDKNLSLEKIAKQFSYSKFYLTRTFKAGTGMTLYKYIQGRRLEEAARKLAESNQPIVEIAFEAGYSSQQAFTQAFRCVYTYTPQEYRLAGIFIPKQDKLSMRMSYTMLLFELTGGRIAA